MDSDRRRHPRLPMQVEVDLFRSGRPAQRVWTNDLSGGGVMILMDDTDRPAVGSWVELQVTGTLGAGETPPLVRAQVVRHLPDGLALSFDDDDDPVD
ncbi:MULTISPECIES: PilZ domain-containing protein [Marichromatium]|uniref:PilZ domain-containing protein n=1 Tax=Marichromatium gracile TaxID=1048 RepID=A0A4V2W962_MARGR|nr:MULTISPECIES: PilZ domain-containing protein [Marichromatium]MBO8086201.1 PilZ domain-containing protein [Marichromatium sp.]MBK1708434.1 pilus assembly protein PilZ [Marichromatium gracile]RNE89752.1 PilZ domain-containing protein [Marichromatium sp. AB31]RNE94296.1 PilZ domain-containing protein [Marichromatium sp. AB32]TCW34190.1 PilZ domain-containing protein [Marichromatium gracile]